MPTYNSDKGFVPSDTLPWARGLPDCLTYFHGDSLVSYADNIKTQRSTSITFIKQRVQNKDRDSTWNFTVRFSNPSKCNIFFSSPKRPNLHWDPSSWPIQWAPAFFFHGKAGEVIAGYYPPPIVHVKESTWTISPFTLSPSQHI